MPELLLDHALQQPPSGQGSLRMRSDDPILAIDPGNERSAYVLLQRGEILGHAILPNEELRGQLARARDRRVAPRDLWPIESFRAPLLCVEMIASYGMPVGREVFETCIWIGRFVEAYGHAHRLVYRRDVKLHLCGSSRAKDANVRQALLDAVGPRGTQRDPGPTYGLRADEWAALAVAVTARDTGEER